MTPTQRTRARAFAIWRCASPRDWNVTYEEIGETTGLTRGQIQKVLDGVGWRWRVNPSRFSRVELKSRRSRNDGFVSDLTQIFSNPRLTSAQEFGIDWG